VIVVLVPVPAIEPGLIVQVPVAGNPLSTTPPVGAVHEEGWVIVPGMGAAEVPTVSVAAFEVMLLAEQLVIATRYWYVPLLVIPVTLRVAEVVFEYTEPAGNPLATAAHVPELLYSHRYANGASPFATTVKVTDPDTAHIAASVAWVPIDTGTQPEETVTVIEKGAPTQVPDVGVTV
jgi:hypothetical protein